MTKNKSEKNSIQLLKASRLSIQTKKNQKSALTGLLSWCTHSRQFWRVKAKPMTAIVASAALLVGSLAPLTNVSYAEETINQVTITPNPSYQQQRFKGWGTSLAWFAEVTAEYPSPVRAKLAQMIFGKNGLNLNIARFNIGGGDAPETESTLRPGGAVPGWWSRPAAYTPPAGTKDPGGWWNPNRADMWNWKADSNQRWWAKAAKALGADTFEAFSNTPPYFMTNSGVVTGNVKDQDQMKASEISNFATYVTRVTQHLQKVDKLPIKTIDPLNEPWDNYWILGGRQEGANIPPATQEKVLQTLSTELNKEKVRAKISAMDETNPKRFVETWNAYSDTTKNVVQQLNTHTYSKNSATAARDISKATGKPLSMSEFEGSWGDGQSFTSMEPGVGMAQAITQDLRNLEPISYVLWQPIEDYKNMLPTAENMNWGEIQIPFDASDFTIRTNTKYDTVRNFTHYIRPGDRLIAVDDSNTTAAISKHGRQSVLVHTNSATNDQKVVIDLSKFGKVSRNATVTPVTTTSDAALKKGRTVRVAGKVAKLNVPAKSVTTFLISGVSGVSKKANPLDNGGTYQVIGVQSGKAIATDGDRVIQRSSEENSTAQQWKLVKRTRGHSNTEQYSLINVKNGKALTGLNKTEAGLNKQSKNDPAQRWIASTTGDGSYTFVNVKYGSLIDVSGQSRDDGAVIDLWSANSGENQLFTIHKLFD